MSEKVIQKIKLKSATTENKAEEPKIISFFEEELMGKKSSLHSAIKRCNDVIYLKAEKMNPLTFFNVNTLEDLNLMKNLLSSNF